ncbi:hypothetical protein BDZ91DRAFT_794061 [Kalaharituber pfeilii]|nr:hypothetical protein BDZ91DRAFT_794061 [Kalaharituber pfeilii]
MVSSLASDTAKHRSYHRNTSPSASPHNHHSDNEFVAILTSGRTGRTGSFSSIASTTSSIEDLLSALRQHERHQQRKQAKMSSSTMVGGPPDALTASTAVMSASSPEKVAPASVEAEAAHPSETVNPGTIGDATDSPSGSSEDSTSDEDEAKLLRRLETKRREIDEEIEAFKLAKEDEYAEYERRLRERKRRKQQRKKLQEEARDGDLKHDTQSQTTVKPKSGILKETSHYEEEPDTELPFAISSPAALMALNEQNLGDPLTISDSTDLAEASPSTVDAEPQPHKFKSPPFEEEIQLAGLFTPRYLPLLDDTYSRHSSISSPRPATPPKQHSPPSRDSPTDSYSRSTSPGAPLASSLKNSASSGFSNASGRHCQLKPKSPKKVSFKLDETTPIPSRSTPPQTVLTFSDGNNFGDDDPDSVALEQVERLDSYSFTPRSNLLNHNSMSKSVVVERQTEPSSFPGESLVMPTKISDGVVEVAGGGQFREGGISPHADNDDWESVDKRDAHGGFGSLDDDEEDMFDMDETMPLSPVDEDGNTNNTDIQSSPSDFDTEEIWAGNTAPNAIIATPHGLREASSLPKYSPISPFGSLGLQATNLPGRRGSMPFSYDGLEKGNAVAASLPTPVYNPSSLRTSKTANGTFRRKSVQKYAETEPDAPPRKDYKGKAIEGGLHPHYAPLLEEEEDESVLPTTFGSSVPISIQRRGDTKGVSKKPVTEKQVSPRNTAIQEAIENAYHEESPGGTPVHASHSPSRSPMFATDEDHQSMPTRVPISVSEAQNDGTSSGSDATPTPESHRIQFVQPFPSYSGSPAQMRSTTPPHLSPASTTPQVATATASAMGHGADERYPLAQRQLFNPFFSPSPYATPLAAQVAAEAAEMGDDDEIGSVVGGVDGSTGLDPILTNQRRGSLALLQGITNSKGLATLSATTGGSVNGRKRAVSSLVGQTIKGGGRATLGEELGIPGIAPEKMSFSIRLALEEHMEKMMAPAGLKGRS